MPSRSVSITITGIDRMAKSLDARYLVADTLNRMVLAASVAGRKAAVKRAPFNEASKAGAHIRDALIVAPRPVSRDELAKAAVSGSVSGFRYPWALNYSRKVAYKYASGPNKGKALFNWWTGAIPSMRRAARKQFRDASREIERRFVTANAGTA